MPVGSSSPGDTALLATPPQAALPTLDKLAAEGVDRSRVGWDAVIVSIAAEHLSQPAPLDRDRLVSVPTQGVTDRPELAPHAFAGAMPHQDEVSFPAHPTFVSKSEKVERVRLSDRGGIVRGGKAPEFD